MKIFRKTVIALLKLGFQYERILGMTEEEALGYIEAYDEIVNPRTPGKKRRYAVRKKGK